MKEKMNERILDLAEKAGFEIDCCSLEWHKRIKRFAELIVRECINQALVEKVSEKEIDQEDDIESKCYLRGYNGGIVDAVIKIQQHFGVEE